MENIYDEIFEFLFEKYLEARAKGEAFYFRIWQSNNTEYKNYLIVSFWKTNDAYINVDLWVNVETNKFYLYISKNLTVIKFDDENDFKQRNENIEKIKRNIYENIAERINKPSKESYAPLRELFSKELVLKTYNNLAEFLEKDKALIDN